MVIATFWLNSCRFVYASDTDTFVQRVYMVTIANLTFDSSILLERNIDGWKENKIWKTQVHMDWSTRKKTGCTCFSKQIPHVHHRQIILKWNVFFPRQEMTFYIWNTRTENLEENLTFPFYFFLSAYLKWKSKVLSTVFYIYTQK